MSYDYESVDWSRHEQNVKAALDTQDAIQAVIDENMRKGDLFEAGVASIEHVLTSLELRDTKEGAFYLNLGLALTAAGAFVVPEHLRDSNAFRVPEEIKESLGAWDSFYGDSSIMYEIQSRKAIEDIEIHLADTEATLGSDLVSTEAKNQTVHDTVKAIGDFYFSDLSYPVKKEALLDFIKKIAENIEVEDGKFSMSAYTTYRRLMLVALHTKGGTNSALSLAARGFSQLADCAQAPMIKSACEQHVKHIRSAQLLKVVNSPVVLTKNVRELAASVHTKSAPDAIWSRPHTPESAIEQYDQISDEFKHAVY